MIFYLKMHSGGDLVKVCLALSTLVLAAIVSSPGRAAPAFPDLSQCQVVVGEKKYGDCIHRLVKETRRLTQNALHKLADRGDDYDDPGGFKASVAQLAKVEQQRSKSWCEIETYESRGGSGFESILESCRLSEELDFLQKLIKFNAAP